MNQALPEPYVIEGSLPDRYPRGWFCIGTDYEFTSIPVKLDYFGTSLVAYRGQNSGQVHILDAYCPHMGANLAGAGSCIQGDSVICPFHAWRWGSDGVCNDIPYAKKIPAKARIRSWPVLEENQLVYVWHDPDGGEPMEEQRIPRDEQVFEDGWTPWVIRRAQVESNCRELIDNMADKAHFGPVHGSEEITLFTNISEGHKYTQLMNGRSPMGTMESEATYYGPGYMIHRLTHQLATGETSRFMSLVMNVPTSLESFEFLAGFKYPVPPGSEGNMVAQIEHVNQLIDANERGVFADLAIWKDKVTIDNPILCDGDGPLTRLRQWYNQFLVPVDQVPESLSERKVYDKSESILFQ
ncbi:MAG: Rieske 2Fe-2S domain-containing protein [Gammaproteobacteria bacterium]|nr:Rieske 2Fe-2S domain-containing protein [Gammaproteobacteria bacterium]